MREIAIVYDPDGEGITAIAIFAGPGSCGEMASMLR